MRTFQWFKRGVPSYLMTVEPLTRELFDEHVKKMMRKPDDTHHGEVTFETFAVLAQEIALVHLPHGGKVL